MENEKSNKKEKANISDLDLTTFAWDIKSKILKDTPNAFNYFKLKWIDLKTEQKRTVADFVLASCLETMNQSTPAQPPYENLMEQKICSSSIRNFILDDLDGKPYFGTLELNSEKDIGDFAAVIKLLYEMDYFDNNLDQIIQVFARVLNIKEGTILSYFNQSGVLQERLIQFLADASMTKLVMGVHN